MVGIRPGDDVAGPFGPYGVNEGDESESIEDEDASTETAMVCKLVESAQERWRAITAPHLVALVRAGARFERGVLVEREPATAA